MLTLVLSSFELLSQAVSAFVDELCSYSLVSWGIFLRKTILPFMFVSVATRTVVGRCRMINFGKDKGKFQSLLYQAEFL